jgi:hypothetical protein
MAPHKEISLSDSETLEVYPTNAKTLHLDAPLREPRVEDKASELANGHKLGGQPALFNPEYALKPRKLRIITIGAGFSGLLIAHKFQHRFPELQEFVHHTIFESRSDIGGTWLVNTYPGVQCDVPSHIYVSWQLLFIPDRTLTE